MRSFRLSIFLACTTFILGALLNGIVYLANDFTMPVITDGSPVTQQSSTSACMFVGKGTYALHTKSATDATVNLPYLADWIFINQQMLTLHHLPRPFRFFMDTVVCFPEGLVMVSPGDLLMWGSLCFILPMLILIGVWKGLLYIRRSVISRQRLP